MANFNFNKVILGGRITADPELKTTDSGMFVTSFSIAVNRNIGNEKKTDFFNCIAWKERAEFITKYFRKGSSICVEGKLQNRNWTDKNDVKHYATDILVDQVYFVDSKSENSSPADNTTTYEEASAAAQVRFEEIDTDDDLPF